MTDDRMTGRSRAPDFETWESPETRVRWERGLAIVAGMIGVVLTFFLLLAMLPISAEKDEEAPLTGAQATAPPDAAAAAQSSPASPAQPTATPATPKLSASAPEASNVRRQPSLNGQVVLTLRPGVRVDVIGRTPDSQWLQIIHPDRPTEKLWVSADRLEVSGDPRTLPEVRE